jgi:nicotinate phosphoribosyltransferase
MTLRNKTDNQSISEWTDKYFTKSRNAIKSPPLVTYGIFVRRPTLMATRLATNWLQDVAQSQNFNINIKENFKEGEFVGAGDPMFYITGKMDHLIELETHLLQKVGASCVAAVNAYDMCLALPKVKFLAMDARHCAGMEMASMMAYAASVGSAEAKKQGAEGFIGNATDATAHFFNNKHGLGTMPHAYIGAFNTTLDAAIAYHDEFPTENLTVLVDYFGQEIKDSLEVCKHFDALARAGILSIRLDTHGGRYIEKLDNQKSYHVLDRNAPEAFRGYRSEQDLKHLTGMGVSAAAIWHMRETLNAAGYDKVKIVASSGFNTRKCDIMAKAKAPIDIVGTGSFLPDKWNETYATADIICYDGLFKVKSGREFLIRDYQERYGDQQK